MKKHNRTIIILVSILLLVFGCKREELTATIYGTVTDYQTGEPIKNVNIKLMPDGIATITGSDGSYSFPELKPGKYSLCFSKAGYAEITDDYVIQLQAGMDFCRDVQMRKRVASLSIIDMEGNTLDTLDFGDEESVSIKSFNVFNDGTETLTCEATYDCDWIVNVSGLENPIGPGQTVTVSVRIDRVALADGENTTFLYIISGNGSNEIVVKATFLGVATISTGEPTDVTASSVTITGDISDDGGRPVLSRGICYGTSQTPDINGNHTEDGAGTGTFSHNITGLSAATTYYARAYATNRNGTYYASNIVSFTTESGLPEVVTADVTDVTATTAKSGGDVTGNGGFEVITRGVCWNTMGGPDLNDQHTENGGGNGSFTSNMTELVAGTVYYVRAYATSSVGTTYGNEISFTTSSGNIDIVLSDPTNVTATSATCNANISNDGGATITERGICWSTSQYPTVTNEHTLLGSGTGSYVASIGGLDPSTTYYVRAYAVNVAGTSYSNQVQFVTTSGLPTINTTNVTDITATTAKSGGNITDNGGFNVVERGVCWNTMGNPDINDSHITNGSGNGIFISNVTGLTPGTTYHIRAYATNSIGTTYGDEYTFTTSSGDVVMTLSDPTNITATSASCSANITDDGGSTIIERGVCWSTSQYPTIDNVHVSIGNGTGMFSSTLSGLLPSTTYYVRAYATNAAGTSYSNQVNFTTNSGLPIVITGIIGGITATSALCSGDVTSDGGFAVTAKGLCWSTTQYPTISDAHTNEGGGTGSFNGSITNLQVGVTYFVRAYATNSVGTEYGEQVSFSTLSGTVSLTTTTVTDITATSAISGGTITDDGGVPVTARGICWNTMGNPDINGSHTTNGSGSGVFTSNISNLEIGVTYYVRAYATNAQGTFYGNEVTFSTLSGTALLTTTAVSDITAVSAKSGGSITDDGGVPVTERGVCWNTMGNPDINGPHTTNGNGLGVFTANITGLTGSTTYFVRAFAINSQGTFYGNETSFTTLGGNVDIILSTPTGITATSASCSANITNDGGAAVTERGICWSTSQYPTSEGSHTTAGSGTGTFSASLSELTPATTYYVRAYAVNATGTSYSNQVSFTTNSGLPVVATSTVSNITATSALCGGDVTSDGGFAVTAKGLCWSTIQYPTISDAHTIEGGGTGSFNGSMTNLQVGTTYYVRAYATNSVGTEYGEQVTFSTLSGTVLLTTTSVSDITAVSAKSGGSITEDGGVPVTARGVCWNTMGNPDINGSHTTNGNGSGTFISNISSLTSNTTYYLRAYATNAQGTFYGNEVNFSTTSGEATVTTGAITNIAALTATSSVTVTDIDGATLQECGICWATTPNPIKESNNSQTASGSQINATYSCNITGLTPNTTYYVRAYATTDVTTSYGNQITFTTVSGLPVLTTTNTSATSVTITSGGNISSDGGYTVTERGVCYSTTNASPTLADNYVSNGMGQGTYSCTITGVSVSTTYYVRAYATNSIGTAYGDVKTIVTGNGLPTVSTTTPTLNGTTVSTGGNITDDGGYAVTARGICYGSLPYPDLSSTYSHTNNGSGMGYYSSSFSLPHGSGTYYVRAYATNANGTSYGEQVAVIQPYDELPTFNFNGHTYKVAPDPLTSTSMYMTWASANTYCETLTLYEYTDWRMPTVEELQTMWLFRNSIGGFSGGEYWSSTQYENSSCHIFIEWNDGTHTQTSSCDSGNYQHYLNVHVRPIRIEN